MEARSPKKKIINAVLYCILLVVYYILCMEKAVETYLKRSTTVVQRQEKSESKSPVLLICPDPPYKPSFFTDLGINETLGAEKYFWVNPFAYQGMFKNSSFTPMELYMNMSYHLEVDMNLFVFRFFTE